MPQSDPASVHTTGVLPPPALIPRGFHLVLAITALLWAAASNAIAERSAAGITLKLSIYTLQPLLASLFLLFLIVVGYALLDRIATRGGSLAAILTLPRRAGWQREWGIGAAAGWALALAVVLPPLLSGHLNGHVYFDLRLTGLALLSLATLVVFTLVEELIFRGYAFRRLIEALGPSWASVVMSVVFALVLLRASQPSRLMNGFLVSALFGLILAMAYLRTHGLWLGWGVHFAYRAVTAVILGLPIAGRVDFSSITDTYARGPQWLTGGQFGLDAAWLTVPLMLGGFALVYRLTRWYAWEYTHPPIVPGGYEVTVAPPAAHVAMEKAAAPPLVQILASTPQGLQVGNEPRPE